MRHGDEIPAEAFRAAELRLEHRIAARGQELGPRIETVEVACLGTAVRHHHQRQVRSLASRRQGEVAEQVEPVARLEMHHFHGRDRLVRNARTALGQQGDITGLAVEQIVGPGRQAALDAHHDLAEVRVPADDVNIRGREEAFQLCLQVGEFRIEIQDLLAFLGPSHADDGIGAPVLDETADIGQLGLHDRSFDLVGFEIEAEDREPVVIDPRREISVPAGDIEAGHVGHAASPPVRTPCAKTETFALEILRIDAFPVAAVPRPELEFGAVLRVADDRLVLGIQDVVEAAVTDEEAPGGCDHGRAPDGRGLPPARRRHRRRGSRDCPAARAARRGQYRDPRGRDWPGRRNC